LSTAIGPTAVIMEVNRTMPSVPRTTIAPTARIIMPKSTPPSVARMGIFPIASTIIQNSVEPSSYILPSITGSFSVTKV